MFPHLFTVSEAYNTFCFDFLCARGSHSQTCIAISPRVNNYLVTNGGYNKVPHVFFSSLNCNASHGSFFKAFPPLENCKTWFLKDFIGISVIFTLAKKKKKSNAVEEDIQNRAGAKDLLHTVPASGFYTGLIPVWSCRLHACWYVNCTLYFGFIWKKWSASTL